MSSWLSISLPNPFKSDDQNPSPPSQHSTPSSGDHSPTVGVKEDLSVLGQTIGRQLRGVAAFLAPPPPPQPPPDSSSQTLVGIRNDLVEIGGSFKSSLSLLSSNKAVSEISRLASNLLQFETIQANEVEGDDEDEDEDDEDDGSEVAGVTDEVLHFVQEISSRSEFWTDFPLSLDNDEGLRFNTMGSGDLQIFDNNYLFYDGSDPGIVGPVENYGEDDAPFLFQGAPVHPCFGGSSNIRAMLKQQRGSKSYGTPKVLTRPYNGQQQHFVKPHNGQQQIGRPYGGQQQFVRPFWGSQQQYHGPRVRPDMQPVQPRMVKPPVPPNLGWLGRVHPKFPMGGWRPMGERRTQKRREQRKFHAMMSRAAGDKRIGRRIQKTYFVMSDAQKEHASTVEDLVPNFAALRHQTCSSLSEEKFWMIYFILLLPRLHEHDAKLLSTPEIVEARRILLQKLHENRNTPVEETSDDSPTINLSQEGERADNTQGHDSPSQGKEVLAESASEERDVKIHHENTDQWLEEEDVDDAPTSSAADAQKQPETEEDVSFSDLEDDDNDLSGRLSSRFKPAGHERVASPNGSNEWVRLNESSGTRDSGLKNMGSTSREKDSEGEDSNDWLTVDDVDSDSVVAV
ncbi:unnamed protein product [Camellia sinensis]